MILNKAFFGTVKLNEHGLITLPKAARIEMGFEPGHMILIFQCRAFNGLLIVPADEAFQAAKE